MPPSDLTVVEEQVSVVEIKAAPYAVTQIVGPDAAGLVEVHDSSSALITVDEPGVQTVAVITAGPIGPRGPAGADGAAGADGPPGPPGTGTASPGFEQSFVIPSTTWVIHHNLDVYPVVTLVDLYGAEIGGDVITPDRNTVVVEFAVPFAGTARLKA